MFTPLLFRDWDLFKRLIREAKKAPLPSSMGSKNPSKAASSLLI